jgi:hypothetical protein
LAKYGGPFRGLKVKNAQEHGMIGCIIFTDPGDDGEITEANGYAPYPGEKSLRSFCGVLRFCLSSKIFILSIIRLEIPWII